MSIKKTIQKPSNWQDFENLCKKLWGEIWGDSSIKKNGRSGQVQHGVDVYGIPKGEKEYYGIQCKGKDDYTNAKLTEKEIDEEINKANNFRPALKKLIFATTANKDSKIEEYIRVKNIENISQNKFSVEVFSWEDIADFIEENRNTFNWYMCDVNHKTSHKVDILFQNEQSKITLEPIFNKYITMIDQNYDTSVGAEFEERKIKNLKLYFNMVNNSFSKIGICVRNSGNVSFEEFKLIVEVENNFQGIEESNFKSESVFSKYIPKFYTIAETRIVYDPPVSKRVLVPKDNQYFEFYLKPYPKEYEIKLRWHFLSKEYDCEGENLISIKPIFKEFKIYRKPQNAEKNGDERIAFADNETVYD